MFGRNVVDRAGTGCLESSQAHFGEAEIREFELITRKQYEVLGLDVAMNDLVLVRMGQGRDGLRCEVQRSCGRGTPLDTLRQRLIAKFHRNDEMIVDVAGIDDG